MTNSAVVHNLKYAPVLFLEIQRKWFLLNCVAGHEAVNSSRGFHSMQSLPPCPLGLYYILLHSARKGEKKNHTDRKFPPEPYNHCNTDTLQPRLVYLTMIDWKTSLDSTIRVVCSCVYVSAFVCSVLQNKYVLSWTKLQMLDSFVEIRWILHQRLRFRWWEWHKINSFVLCSLCWAWTPTSTSILALEIRHLLSK